MVKNRKQMLLIIISFVLIIFLGTTTYAFFNYTRTGTSNVIKTGRIYFNSEQGNTINLDNLFPVDKTNIDNEIDYVGTATIHITGDTTYTDGIEYLITAVNVNNAIGEGNNSKYIPISVDVSYEEEENKTIGTSDNHYFDNRGGNNSLYKILAGDVIYENANLAVGYIARGSDGIDGTITIKAFIDKDNIAITDTYASNIFSKIRYSLNTNMTAEELTTCVNKVKQQYTSQTDEVYEAYCQGIGTINNKMFLDHLNNGYYSSSYKEYFVVNNIIFQYENGTTNEWVDGRTVLTTDEWNNLQSNGISFQVKVEANEGIWVREVGNSIKSSIEDGIFDSNITENIKEVYFNSMSESAMQSAYDAATLKVDLTYNNEGKVLAWLEENIEENTKYTMYIVSDGKTDFPKNSEDLFYNLKINEASVIEFNNVNTSKVTSMYNMFYYCDNVETLDLTSFDTSNVTNMSYMFYSLENVKTIDMSNLDLRKVTNMQSMFSGLPELVEIDFSNSKTRDIVNMYNMFGNSCTKLETVNLDGFGGDNLNSIIYFIPNNVKHLSMKNFNFGQASLAALFSGHGELVDVDLSGSIINSASLSSMFYSNAKLTSVNLENVHITGLKNTSSMFEKCSLLTNIDLSSMNFEELENASSMFKDSSTLTTITVLNDTDLSNIQNGTNMFSGCTSIVGGNNTTYDANHIDKEYARIDALGTPGYFTLKTE